MSKISLTNLEILVDLLFFTGVMPSILSDVENSSEWAENIGYSVKKLLLLFYSLCHYKHLVPNTLYP